MTITDMPETGDPPIYDTRHLFNRISQLGPEGQEQLRQRWVEAALGQLPGLADAETYRKAERLVYGCEPQQPDIAADWLRQIEERVAALPDHVRLPLQEALSVYAGVTHPSKIMLCSVGRWNEINRLLGEAEAYTATLVDEPSVDSLPPVDDQAPVTEAHDYPGVKADAKTILAWVGDDRNRAARAYMHEQMDRTPRKGVTAKLTDVLGPEGLTKVTEAIDGATPPPLDLGPAPETPEELHGTGSTGEGGSGGDGVPQTPEVSVGCTADVETAPAAPNPDRLRSALANVAVALTELADAMAEAAA